VLEEHKNALKQILKGRQVSHIFVTHHHSDHSPLAAPLAKEYGCKVYGRLPKKIPRDSNTAHFEESPDSGFLPDVELSGGEIFKGDGWTLEAIHTPGHTSNHICFALREENTLFSGDHIMGWSTSVVSPPDGHMGDYMNSLHRVLDGNFDRIIPTHGPAIENPREFVESYISHRLEREHQILEAITSGLATIPEIVTKLYTHVDKRLHPAAAHSVLAHIIYLRETGRVKATGPDSLKTNYTLGKA